MFPILVWCLSAAAVIYLLAAAALVLGQRRLLYRPMPARRDPEAAGASWMTPVCQAKKLLGWFAPPPEEDAPTLVFFHGNRGTLARAAAKTAAWRVEGIGIFVATYRGYEGNPGRPSEAGLYADGRAVLDWLAEAGIPASRIILYGESLGTGVVTQLAGERPFRAVVLESPFASITDIAARRYPWIPCRWLLRDRFDSLSKIGGIVAPLLILHGGADRTVPVEHARKLAEAAPKAQLVVLPEADHLNLHERGATPPLLAFLKGL